MSFALFALVSGGLMIFGGGIAALAKGAPQLLAGLILVSLGASGFMLNAGVPSVYALVLCSLFLITDLIIFLFLRSRELGAENASLRPRFQVLFRFLTLSSAFSVAAFSAWVLWRGAREWKLEEGGAFIFDIWAQHSFFLLLTISMLPLLFIGGFLLIRGGGGR
jgi:nitrogen fixation/metabolism regulation signal transduction histidine kinase